MLSLVVDDAEQTVDDREMNSIAGRPALHQAASDGDQKLLDFLMT